VGEVVFVTRAGCTACAASEPAVRRAADEAGVPLVVRDVDADPELLRRFTDKVPVVLLDGREHGYWRIDERGLRRALGLRV
jgi:glutaredoxin